MKRNRRWRGLNSNRNDTERKAMSFLNVTVSDLDDIIEQLETLAGSLRSDINEYYDYHEGSSVELVADMLSDLKHYADDASSSLRYICETCYDFENRL